MNIIQQAVIKHTCIILNREYTKNNDTTLLQTILGSLIYVDELKNTSPQTIANVLMSLVHLTNDINIKEYRDNTVVFHSNRNLQTIEANKLDFPTLQSLNVTPAKGKYKILTGKSYKGKFPTKVVQILNNVPLVISKYTSDLIFPNTGKLRSEKRMYAEELTKKYGVIDQLKGKKFYLNWFCDSRLRMYPRGKYITPQGADADKSIIQIVTRERINRKGREAQRIEIANHYGLDRKSWTERLLWVATNEHRLEELVDEAKNPFQYVRAIGMYREKDVNSVVSLDATSSGLQIMSALAGCKKGLVNSNVIPNGERNDIYTRITEVMNNVCPDSSYDRKSMKKPIMTTFYNSSREPEKALKNDISSYWSVLQEEAPGALKVMGYINKEWNSKTDHQRWTTPDGFTCNPYNYETVSVEINVIGVKEPMPFLQSKTIVENQGVSLVADFVQSLDAYAVREVVLRAKKQGFNVFPTHDCFMVHPNYARKLTDIYSEIMKEITRDNILQNTFGTKFDKLDTGIWKEVRTGYALS